MESRRDRKIISSFCVPFSFSIESGMVLEGESEEKVFLGFSVAELGGSSFIERMIPAEREKFLSVLTGKNSDDPEVEMLLSLCRKDGSFGFVFMRGWVVLSEQGNREIQGVMVEAAKTAKIFSALRSDVEKWRVKLSETEDIVTSLTLYAEKDPLTQILNTAATRRQAEEYLQGGNKNCALIIIDMDDFKQINDSYGHMTGDEVLINVAKIIRKLFRSRDIVGRIGGDEFLVLMKDVSEKEILATRCSQILEEIKNIRCNSMTENEISCSVGAVFSSQKNNTYDALFAAADKAMYRVKGSGKAEFQIEE